MTESVQPKKAYTAWAIQVLIVLASLCWVCWGMRTVLLGETACSRLATAYSLVHHGTWRLDRPLDEAPNPFESLTIDKVEVDGHILSTKPPILPLAMTAEYWFMNRALGWRLDVEENKKPIIQVMTVTLIGGAYLIILLFFTLSLALVVENPWHRAPLLFALAFGSQLPGFATQINNHIPGTAMMVVAVYLALGLGSGKRAPRPWRFIAFGIASGLVFTLDIPLTIFVAVAGLFLFVRFPKQAALWGGLGLAIPLTIHFGIMTAITGSPIPVQMRDNLYLYEASYWRNPGGIDALHEPRLTYLFHMTFGRFGSFLLFPVLLLGLAGFARAVIQRETPWRGYVLGGGLAFGVLSLYYLTKTNNYGGMSYGFRWYIGAMPVLLLMATPIVDKFRRWRHWIPALLLVSVSMYSAWECYQNPWSTNHEWTCRHLYGPAFKTESTAPRVQENVETR